MGENGMNAENFERAFILDWDLSHLGDDDYDAQLVHFSGWEDSLNLLLSADQKLPDRILFEANFRTLEKVEYPYNDVRWPIMSRRMLSVLTSLGGFSFREVPVGMLDDRVPTGERFEPSGAPKAAVTKDGFSGVALDELLELFDYEQSEYEHHPAFPDYISRIVKLILKDVDEDYPPLFRLKAFPTILLVSATAKKALEREGITGVEYRALSEYRTW